MPHIFTPQENQTWLANLLKKSIAVKLILKSKDNQVLLVKPSYKKTWQLPGGGVEAQEEPRTALAANCVKS